MRKFLSFFQIAGGVTGILFVLSVFIGNPELGPVILVGFFAICFYVYSCYCGIALLKRTKNSFNYTLFNLLLQILHVSVPKFIFEYVSGLSISLGLSSNNTTIANFDIGFSVFKFSLNQNINFYSIEVNFIALFLFYKTMRMSKSNKTNLTVGHNWDQL